MFPRIRSLFYLALTFSLSWTLRPTWSSFSTFCEVETSLCRVACASGLAFSLTLFQICDLNSNPVFDSSAISLDSLFIVNIHIWHSSLVLRTISLFHCYNLLGIYLSGEGDSDFSLNGLNLYPCPYYRRIVAFLSLFILSAGKQHSKLCLHNTNQSNLLSTYIVPLSKQQILIPNNFEGQDLDYPIFMDGLSAERLTYSNT